jgi:hypothetical protein
MLVATARRRLSDPTYYHTKLEPLAAALLLGGLVED